MTNYLVTNYAKKNDLERLEGINVVFLRNDLIYFVTNKTKMLFELFGIGDMTEYISHILRSHINCPKRVNDTTGK